MCTTPMYTPMGGIINSLLQTCSNYPIGVYIIFIIQLYIRRILISGGPSILEDALKVRMYVRTYVFTHCYPQALST